MALPSSSQPRTTILCVNLIIAVRLVAYHRHVISGQIAATSFGRARIRHGTNCLPVTSPAISAVQLRHVTQIVGGDICPNIVPHDIPAHALWRHPSARIGVNDSQAIIGEMRRHQLDNLFRNLDDGNAGDLGFR
jgi:hypothetical protein